MTWYSLGVKAVFRELTRWRISCCVAYCSTISTGGLSMISRRLISFLPCLFRLDHTGRLHGSVFFWNGASSEAHYQCSAPHRWKGAWIFRIKGIDRFDQTDSSDGDQVFRIFTGTLIFFTMWATRRRLCSIRIFFAAKSPSR